MVTHTSIVAWGIPWTEEPGGLLSGHKESDPTEQQPPVSVSTTWRAIVTPSRRTVRVFGMGLQSCHLNNLKEKDRGEWKVEQMWAVKEGACDKCLLGSAPYWLAGPQKALGNDERILWG